MKKLLACGLILTMLSSTGAMCFAKPETVNTIQVSATDIVVTEESQDNKLSQEELLSDIEAIKSNKSLTVKERFEKVWDSVKEFVESSVSPEGKLAKAWNYVKNFVKERYIAVTGFAAVVVFSLLALLCGPTVVDALKGLLKSDSQEEEQARLEAEAEEEFNKKFAEAFDAEEARLEAEAEEEFNKKFAEVFDAEETRLEAEAERLAKEQAEKVEEEKLAQETKEQKGFFGRLFDAILPSYDND